MTDRPIIFSAPMVRALLEGTKTQTRRIIKPQPKVLKNGIWYRPYPVLRPLHWNYLHGDYIAGFADLSCAPGDRFYVREACSFPQAWLHQPDRVHIGHVFYAASADAPTPSPWPRQPSENHTRIRPSIHMPRWASRLTLTVTDARVQRLQDISRGDAMAEGCPFANMRDGPSPCDWYADLWNSLHGDGAWKENPWVAAISFSVQKVNIDQLAAA